MVTVTFTVDETGEEIRADAGGLPTLMQVALENDVPGIEGECGGEMTCGTCHVWVESTPSGYDATVGDDELDMLDVFDNRVGASRLSCQIRVGQHLDGMAVRVPTA